MGTYIIVCVWILQTSVHFMYYLLEEDNIHDSDRGDDGYLCGGIEGGVGASVDTPTN